MGELTLEIGKKYITRSYDVVYIEDSFSARLNSGAIADIFVGVMQDKEIHYLGNGKKCLEVVGQSRFAEIPQSNDDILEEDNDVCEVVGGYIVYKLTSHATSLEVQPNNIEVEELKESQPLTITTEATDYTYDINTEIATFDKIKKTITGVAQGETTLTIKAKAENKTESTAIVSVSVIEATPAPIETKLEADKEQIDITDTGSEVVTITTNADTIEAEVENDTYATCDVNKKEITINGVAEGATNLIVKARMTGTSPKQITIPINVTATI